MVLVWGGDPAALRSNKAEGSATSVSASLCTAREVGKVRVQC